MTSSRLSKNVIKDILNLAIYAPSGDNSQPWKFRIKENSIDIILIKAFDKSLYNFQEAGSLFAHGALVENIEIISTKYGFNTTVNYFPNGRQSDVVVTINLHKDKSIKEHLLFPYIKLRHTNRKFYDGKTLSQDQKNSLINIAPEIESAEVRFIENLIKQKSLIEAISFNDRLLFENKYIHDILFQIINWTEEEDKQKGTGLFIKTLELSPDQRVAFRKFRSWNTVKVLNKLGIPKLMAKQTQRLYSTSAAIGVVIIDSDTPQNYLLAGRVFQRLWLLATKEGLSIHPVTGIVYLAKRVKGGDYSRLSQKDRELIMEADKRIGKSFNLEKQNITMLFRIGHSEKPSARSSRLPLKIIT